VPIEVRLRSALLVVYEPETVNGSILFSDAFKWQKPQSSMVHYFVERSSSPAFSFLPAG